MDRKSFVNLVSALSLPGTAVGLAHLRELKDLSGNTEKMPVLFVGHGSPMNAIVENEFTEGWKRTVRSIPKPRAILCISAHWETRGTWLTTAAKPRTIHDFGGFPKALYEVSYPAPGDPGLALSAKTLLEKYGAGLDQNWGLDHGAWSVIMQMYPDAGIPVVQLSLDHGQSPRYHYELAKNLAALREKGVLIIGSGNIVHNLGMVAWDRLNDDDYGYDWAIEAKEKMKKLILDGDHNSLVAYREQGRAFHLSAPTPEHYLPLLYVLALKGTKESADFFNDKCVGGSLAMTSLIIKQL